MIGCGGYKLIDSYAKVTKCPYPIYTDPTLSLYKLFDFKRTLQTSAPGVPQKEYEKDLGSLWARTFSTIKVGLGQMGGLGGALSKGPADQNGGEMIIEKGRWPAIRWSCDIGC